ncbi:long-chain acyl-CoA synthetase 2 [Wolffia australiana]
MALHTVQVGEARPGSDGKPSAGPVYRCVYAEDGLTQVPSALNCPWDFLCGSVTRYPRNPMLGEREIVDGSAGQYAWQTYEQVYDEAIQVGSAMRERLVNPGDRCGIYGTNCPKWVIAMEACNSHGICYVPLYDTLGAHAVEFIINHAEVSIAFVQESKLSSILACLPKCSSHLKTIVSFGEVSQAQEKEASQLGVSCFSWKEFSSLGKTTVILPPKGKEDLCTIMYTSGTTGDPKGVRLTNGAVIAQVVNTELLLKETDKVATEEDSYFSFLPLAHVFDQIMENYCIYKGASVGFWRGDVRYLMEDVRELKPTIFCGVPRVYDRIHASVLEKLSAGGALARRLFQYAYDYKLKNLKRGLKQDEAAPLFDRLVFNKIKQVLGGRTRILISGAAPLPEKVEEFLRVATCSVVIQGYGLTESCAGCFTSISNVFSMMGTVGVPATTVEARLESVPEMGYDAVSSTPRGEICLRGTTLFSGYHRRPDLTASVVDDEGWFHTGDVGEWLPNGAMKIIDRKKNIFKLSQGEYVAVENIEAAYAQCPIVAAIWVYGNSFESFLVGVVVPEKAALEGWAAANGLSCGGFHSLCENQKTRDYVLEELDKTARAHQLKGFEMVKAIHLETAPFNIERDLITPTFKLKRAQLLKYYQSRVDQLYEEGKDRKRG